MQSPPRRALIGAGAGGGSGWFVALAVIGALLLLALIIGVIPH